MFVDFCKKGKCLKNCLKSRTNIKSLPKTRDVCWWVEFIPKGYFTSKLVAQIGLFRKTASMVWTTAENKDFFRWCKTMVFCYQNCSDLLWEKLEFRGWRPWICKIFEITRTIYSSSERSEQFFVTDYFFNLFLEVSNI